MFGFLMNFPAFLPSLKRRVSGQDDEELVFGSGELSLERIRGVKSGVKIEDRDEYGASFLAHMFPHVQNNIKSIIVNCVLPVTWHSIFVHFPKLEKLDIRLCELARISHDLKSLRSGNMNIKELRVNFFGSTLLTLSDFEHSLETLLNLPLAHFQLETVFIDASSWRDSFSTASLIEQQASTLTKFGLSVREKLAARAHFFCGTQNGDSLNLTELHLQGHACPDFHFLEQLPGLKILRLEKCYPNMIQETVLGRLEMLTSLPHLHYFDVEVTLGAEEVKMFAKVMPNVKILKTCLTTEGFRVVCQKWRSLRELELRSASEREILTKDAIGDESLTGIVDGCGELLPNITDLRHLQHLCIRSEGRISDSSVWNGFLELPNLRRLSVALAKETSDEAYDALLSHLQNSTGSEITRK